MSYRDLIKFLYRFLIFSKNKIIPKIIYRIFLQRIEFKLFAISNFRNGRMYINLNKMSLENFFNILEENGINYVVLRWFEDFPKVRKDGDIDILVQDEHVKNLRKFLAKSPNTLQFIPVEIFTVSGCGGYMRKNLPIYPREFSYEILTNSIRGPLGSKIPNKKDYLDSLSYHAIYHKGELSGINSKSKFTSESAPSLEHDYVSVLNKLAIEVGTEVEVTFDGIEKYLRRQNREPNLDLKLKLGISNIDVRESAIRQLRKYIKIPGLCIFILRYEKNKNLIKSLLIEDLKRENFLIIFEKKILNKIVLNNFLTIVRGGNWCLPDNISNDGLDYFVICVIDKYAKSNPEDLEGLNYVIDNARTHKFKLNFRLKMQSSKTYFELHSTDCARQAIYYYANLDPTDAGFFKLRNKVKSKLELTR